MNKFNTLLLAISGLFLVSIAHADITYLKVYPSNDGLTMPTVGVSTGGINIPIMDQLGRIIMTNVPPNLIEHVYTTLTNTTETVVVSSPTVVNVKVYLISCAGAYLGTNINEIVFRGSGNGGTKWFPIGLAPGPAGFIHKDDLQPTSDANITAQLTNSPTGGNLDFECDYILVKTQ
jgi:hypothetical protein